MTLLESVLLGLIQGLTEFLPVSSSGHLVLAQNVFGITEPMLLFDVMLHFGTLLAVFIYFGRDIASILLSLAGKESKSNNSWSGTPQEARRFILWIIIATIPAGVAGVLFNDFIESAFSSIRVVGIDLLITGAVLAFADRAPASGKKAASLGPVGALAVGIAQMLAIMPGISRSGSTICMALFLGLDRKEAARFSFILSIPVILGATAMHVKDALEAGVSFTAPIAAGTFVAFASGLAALAWLIAVLVRGRLISFSIYCWVVGAAAIVGSFFL